MQIRVAANEIWGIKLSVYRHVKLRYKVQSVNQTLEIKML